MVDINSGLGFARSTLSIGSSSLLQAQSLVDALRGVGKWQIFEAAYLGGTKMNKFHPPLVPPPPVRFHVFTDKAFNAGLTKAEDTGGRRKAIYKFPYVDGQTTNDLGREGGIFTFEAIIHGPNYKANWLALEKELNDPVPGNLTHPVRGVIRAAPRGLKVVHEAQSRMAVLLQIEFIEHNFTLADPSVDSGSKGLLGTLSGALSFAVSLVKNIENVINYVQSVANIITSFRNGLKQQLDDLKSDYSKQLINLNTSFNDDVSGIPSIDQPSQGVGASPLDPTIDAVSGQVLTTNQAVDSVNAYRAKVKAIIASIESAGEDLTFFDQVNDLTATAIALQQVVEAGIKSSKPKIIEYTTTREMSLREVAFSNGLNPDQMIDIDLMNPDLDSVNMIAKGITLQIPVVR